MSASLSIQAKKELVNKLSRTFDGRLQELVEMYKLKQRTLVTVVGKVKRVFDAYSGGLILEVSFTEMARALGLANTFAYYQSGDRVYELMTEPDANIIREDVPDVGFRLPATRSDNGTGKSIEIKLKFHQIMAHEVFQHVTVEEAMKSDVRAVIDIVVYYNYPVTAGETVGVSFRLKSGLVKA